jgi:hypothetical protein
MPSPTEYAQIAARVYFETYRGNRAPVPQGWLEVRWWPDTATGFSGGIYRNE